MKSLGKHLTFAVVALGLGVIAMPSAMACGANVITQPAVIDTSLTQPAVIDNSCSVLTQPAVVDNSCAVMTQPAVLDSCGTCGSTVLTQPAIIERPRHHLFDLGTPLFDVTLF